MKQCDLCKKEADKLIELGEESHNYGVKEVCEACLNKLNKVMSYDEEPEGNLEAREKIPEEWKNVVKENFNKETDFMRYMRMSGKNEKTGEWFKAQFEDDEPGWAKRGREWLEESGLLEGLSVEIPKELYTVTTYAPVPEKNGLVELTLGFVTKELRDEFLEVAKQVYVHVDIHPLNSGELN